MKRLLILFLFSFFLFPVQSQVVKEWIIGLDSIQLSPLKTIYQKLDFTKKKSKLDSFQVDFSVTSSIVGINSIAIAFSN